MKKFFKWCALVLALLALVVYVQFLLLSEGINRFDGTNRIKLLENERQIELPWYLSMGDTRLYYTQDGTGSDGSEYTRFGYDHLPDIFDFEMEIIANWTDGTSAIYIGESRGMEYIDVTYYPGVEWSEPAWH